MMLERVGAVDCQIVDLAELQGGDERGLGIAHVGAGSVRQNFGGKTGGLVKFLGETQHLHALIARGIGIGIRAPDLDPRTCEDLIPVLGPDLAREFALVGVDESHRVAGKAGEPGGVAGTAVRGEEIFRDDGIVGDGDEIGRLMQLGDLLRHLDAAAELRLYGYFRIFPLEDVVELLEGDCERAGGEERQGRGFGR